MDDLIQLPSAPWTPDDTELWLTQNPLPQDFTWPHRKPNADGSDNWQPVLPSYRLHKGYGFWLRTTPYFPGLFEEIHAILLAIGNELPTADALADTLLERRKAAGTQAGLALETPLSDDAVQAEVDAVRQQISPKSS
jgi:hypothetical protein